MRSFFVVLLHIGVGVALPHCQSSLSELWDNLEECSEHNAEWLDYENLKVIILIQLQQTQPYFYSNTFPNYVHVASGAPTLPTNNLALHKHILWPHRGPIPKLEAEIWFTMGASSKARRAISGIFASSHFIGRIQERFCWIHDLVIQYTVIFSSYLTCRTWIKTFIEHSVCSNSPIPCWSDHSDWYNLSLAWNQQIGKTPSWRIWSICPRNSRNGILCSVSQ